MNTIDAIKEILHENLDIDESSITEASTLDSLGIDSLDMVELIVNIEDKFGIDLGEPEGIETIGQFVQYIDGLK